MESRLKAVGCFLSDKLDLNYVYFYFFKFWEKLLDPFKIRAIKKNMYLAQCVGICYLVVFCISKVKFYFVVGIFIPSCGT